MSKISDIKVVATSAGVSLLDVILNITVAILTSSTVMLSQALQGLSDLITGGILFFGVKRSYRQHDSEFQFGYGRELFFWVLVAGIIMFAGTGVTSLWFGYQQIVNPTPVENIWLAFAMLTFGFFANGYALSLSIQRLRGQDKSKHWLKHLLHSSIIETKATFIIDCLGTSSTVLGLLALGLFLLTGDARFDGVGSVLIGLSMMYAALMLIRDVRDLIVGKAVDQDTNKRIARAAKRVDGVEDVLDLRTMYLGSERLLVVLEVHLKDGLDTDAIELITDNIKHSVQRLVPIVHHIQVEIETPEID
ncbi:MAG TPA: cation diffusion facilitator family transporter [Candidatus Saccharimonadales bacterium]